MNFIRRRLVALALGLAAVLTSTLIAVPASAATAVGPGTYEESSSAISYSSSWSRLSSSGSSGGAIRYSSSTSASATLTFTGPTITWYTWKSASGGIVDVYLDGVKVASVDNYASSTSTRVIGYRNTSLSAGTHTITVKPSGLKNAKSSARFTHLDSFVVGADRSHLDVPASDGRIASCPAATKTVDTSAELRDAFASARAGDVIRLLPGTYTDGFTLTARGTEAQPIWVCGSPESVLTGASNRAALWVEFSEHVNLAGFRVTDALQGVMVRSSSQISVADLQVHDTGYEGIHLYRNTTDSQVMHNTITRTGVADVSYGEGIYIGTSERRWDEVTGGSADRSDRNTVAFNTITAAGAEGIEAKEGTSNGIIAANTVNGHLPGSRAIGWVLVTGNSWYIAGNTGSDAVEHGFSSMAWNSWGNGNKFFANSGTVDAAGHGVWVHNTKIGVQVACDNVPTAAGSGLTNVFCTP